MLWIFIICLLLFLPAVIKAISKIRSDNREHKRAKEKLRRFEDQRHTKDGPKD